MSKLEKLNPERVFYYFEQISAIPRGSGSMDKIASYCEGFAKSMGLEYIRDNADNVIIFKPAGLGYENSEPVILQGHLDMVCQKTEDSTINFDVNGIDLYRDGDFLKAKGTTLGADNGIAVAMILAILEDKTAEHPPIEAVFTVDEEVGMLGAMALDMSVLKGRKMINIDSEDEGIITVSCAGGGDIEASLPLLRTEKTGTLIKLTLKGLKGGHSGIEIGSGRVNGALLLGRILEEIEVDFDILSISGGDKSNAIPKSAEAVLCVSDEKGLKKSAEEVFAGIKAEIASREPNAEIAFEVGERGEYSVFEKKTAESLIFTLIALPNGVMEMSSEIEGLVETSLNLGIMNTTKKSVELCVSLRSSKKTAMDFLTRRVSKILKNAGFVCEATGYYPPWEYNPKSVLKDVFGEVYKKMSGREPQIAAIHAGLECGVFSSGIEGLDCISVGPEMADVHTTDEKLSISSAERLFDMLSEVLKKLK